MPDVDRAILALRLALVTDNSVEGRIAISDTTYLIDDDDMDGVAAELAEEDFTSYTDEDLHLLAIGLANETVGQIFESLLSARTQLREAIEEVDTIEMFQNQEPDWEV
ncbi:MAG: hypothetical protein ACXACW_16455 [Candidatus Hodarchaeales archaeon]|jgi:hypothetical protein